MSSGQSVPRSVQHSSRRQSPEALASYADTLGSAGPLPVREQVATELKSLAGDFHLSEEQKEKLHAALAEGWERMGEYLKDARQHHEGRDCCQGERASWPDFTSALLSF